MGSQAWEEGRAPPRTGAVLRSGTWAGTRGSTLGGSMRPLFVDLTLDKSMVIQLERMTRRALRRRPCSGAAGAQSAASAAPAVSGAPTPLTEAPNRALSRSTVS